MAAQRSTCTFNCARCEQAFLNKNQLLTHMERSHNIKTNSSERHECIECGNCCGSHYKLILHLSTHRPQEYNCSVCPAKFTFHLNLFNHLRMKHPTVESIRKCGECGLVCKSIPALSMHKLVHKPPQYTCEQCQQQFFTRPGLNAHLRFAHSIQRSKSSVTVDNLECVKCQKWFKNAASLNNHMGLHKSMSYKCSNCCAEFRKLLCLDKHLLKVHKVTASTGRYTCAVCGKSFNYKLGLFLHISNHGTPKYRCSRCGLMFYRKVSLVIHEKIYNRPQTTTPKSGTDCSYGCAVCSKLCVSRKRLCGHLHRHYLPTLKCPECNLIIHSQAGLKVHLLDQHSIIIKQVFLCGVCKKEFSNERGLSLHGIWHRSPEVPCSYCNQMFHSRSQQVNHLKYCTGKSGNQIEQKRRKTFGCANCLRSFGDRCCLSQHLRVHRPPTLACMKCSLKFRSDNCLLRHVKRFHAASE